MLEGRVLRGRRFAQNKAVDRTLLAELKDLNKKMIATNRQLLTELNKMRVPHDGFNLTIADENVPDSPIEGKL